MKWLRENGLNELVQLPAAVVAMVLLTWLLQDFALRVVYPWDIEWMEGGMLVHVWRLREGLGMYVEPSSEFVPYIYPPLYPWLMSLIGEPSYAIGRSVSLCGAVAAGLAAVAAARQEGAGWGLSLGALGLWVSLYDESGGFYDLVRADALAIGLTAWSMVLVRRGSRLAVIAGGLLLVLGFLAKHNFAAFGLPMLIWLWRTHGRRRALEFVGASVVPALVATIGIQIATDGWFLDYLLRVPGSHPMVAERAWPISEKELATHTLLPNIGAAVVLVVFGFMKRRHHRALYWGGMLVIATTLCILMRAHHGGFINVLMPGHWTYAVVGVVAMSAGVQALPRFRWVGWMIASALVAWQAWDSRWDREKNIPTAADYEAGEELIEIMQGIEGDIWAPHFPWYPTYAGKKPFAPLIAIWDIDHKHGPMKKYVKGIKDDAAQQRYGAALGPRKDLKMGIQEAYTKKPLGVPGNGLRTKTGWRVRPSYLWLPKDQPANTPDE
jgi:hypothetical protein